MRGWCTVWGILVCCPSGCTVSNVPTVVAAPVFAGTAVAATGARRAASGGCWANCSKGWHCDEESGMCKRDDEQPRRAVESSRQAKESETEGECRAPLRCEGANGGAETASAGADGAEPLESGGEPRRLEREPVPPESEEDEHSEKCSANRDDACSGQSGAGGEDEAGRRPSVEE